MPGKGYPKDRVASTKYESGEVKDSGKFKDVNGSEGYTPSRAGKPASSTGMTNPPKRAGA